MSLVIGDRCRLPAAMILTLPASTNGRTTAYDVSRK